MIISETYIKRLQQLAGLLLENNAGKIKNFGLTDEVAQFLSEQDDKLAIFLANITLFDFAKKEGITENNLKDIIPLINQDEFMTFLEQHKEQIRIVLDWVKSPFRQGEVNFKQIETLTQALQMADDWVKSLQSQGAITDAGGEIVKTYLKDGLYWLDLKTNSSREESAAMGHCGQDSRASTLFSLRDTTKSSNVTISYNEQEKTVYQVKGKANQKPLPKYMPFVFDFLQELISHGKLTNFKTSDLNQAEIDYIFSGNMDVYIKSMLEANLKNKTYVPISFTKEQIINVIGLSEYANYINQLLEKNLANPNYRLKLKKGDITTAIGQEGYATYIRNLMDKAMVNPNYQVNLPKNEIIATVGEEKYNQYVDGIINALLLHPLQFKLSMPKDEFYALLGADRYKDFMSRYAHSVMNAVMENPVNYRVTIPKAEFIGLIGPEKYNEFVTGVVRKIASQVKTESSLKYILRKHDIELTPEQIKAMVGSKVWFNFIKNSYNASLSNIGRSGLDY